MSITENVYKEMIKMKDDRIKQLEREVETYQNTVKMHLATINFYSKENGRLEEESAGRQLRIEGGGGL